MKRVYFVNDECDTEGVAVVAHSAKEAKSIAWNSESDCFCDGWIGMRVNWMRDKDVSDLDYGVVDGCVGL